MVQRHWIENRQYSLISCFLVAIAQHSLLVNWPVHKHGCLQLCACLAHLPHRLHLDRTSQKILQESSILHALLKQPEPQKVFALSSKTNDCKDGPDLYTSYTFAFKP